MSLSNTATPYYYGQFRKAVMNGEVLIDLTGDTVTASWLKKGVTAHDKAGVIITGTLDQSEEIDGIDRVLTYGFSEGTRTLADDGTVVAQDSADRLLTRTFSEDGKTCTSVLADADGVELGTMVKTYGEDFSQVTITDRHGNVKVKKISYSGSQVDVTVE